MVAIDWLHFNCDFNALSSPGNDIKKQIKYTISSSVLVALSLLLDFLHHRKMRDVLRVKNYMKWKERDMRKRKILSFSLSSSLGTCTRDSLAKTREKKIITGRESLRHGKVSLQWLDYSFRLKHFQERGERDSHRMEFSQAVKALRKNFSFLSPESVLFFPSSPSSSDTTVISSKRREMHFRSVTELFRSDSIGCSASGSSNLLYS